MPARALGAALLLALAGCGGQPALEAPPTPAEPTAAIVQPPPLPSAQAVATLAALLAGTATAAAPTSTVPPPPSAVLETPPASPAPASRVPAAVTEGAPDAPEGAAELERRLVAAINELRVGNGLAAYAPEPDIGEVARAHSCDLAAHGAISHVSSDGRTLQDRMAGSAGRWVWPSESIAAGTDDPAAVIAMWMDEPPDGWHRRNLLDTEQQVVGVGFCAAPDDPSGNRFYWTMVVARRP